MFDIILFIVCVFIKILNDMIISILVCIYVSFMDDCFKYIVCCFVVNDGYWEWYVFSNRNKS